MPRRSALPLLRPASSTPPRVTGRPLPPPLPVPSPVPLLAGMVKPMSGATPPPLPLLPSGALPMPRTASGRTKAPKAKLNPSQPSSISLKMISRSRGKQQTKKNSSLAPTPELKRKKGYSHFSCPQQREEHSIDTYIVPSDRNSITPFSSSSSCVWAVAGQLDSTNEGKIPEPVVVPRVRGQTARGRGMPCAVKGVDLIVIPPALPDNMCSCCH